MVHYVIGLYHTSIKFQMSNALRVDFRIKSQTLGHAFFQSRDHLYKNAYIRLELKYRCKLSLIDDKI